MLPTPLNADFQGVSRQPGIPKPTVGVVHVWSFCTSSIASLTSEESLRAEAFLDPLAKAAFVRGRSGLRTVGSWYLGVPPGDLSIETAAGGKPFYVGEETVRFNLSHCGSNVVAAFASEEIGIDIEDPARITDFLAIAKRYFQPSENQLILGAGDQGREMFFRIWTAKEALLKLSGQGLAGGLELAESDGGSHATLAGQRVFIRHFSRGAVCGAIASFSPFEVKGWFEI